MLTRIFTTPAGRLTPAGDFAVPPVGRQAHLGS